MTLLSSAMQTGLTERNEQRQRTRRFAQSSSPRPWLRRLPVLRVRLVIRVRCMCQTLPSRLTDACVADKPAARVVASPVAPAAAPLPRREPKDTDERISKALEAIRKSRPRVRAEQLTRYACFALDPQGAPLKLDSVPTSALHSMSMLREPKQRQVAQTAQTIKVWMANHLAMRRCE